VTQTNELTELIAHHYRIITDVKLILFNIYFKTIFCMTYDLNLWNSYVYRTRTIKDRR